MKRLPILLGEEEGYFGPGMDLAISLAALLLFMLAVKSSVDERERQNRLELEARLRAQITFVEGERKSQLKVMDREKQGQIEIREVLSNQALFVDALASRLGTSCRAVAPNVYSIALPARARGESPDIVIENDATLQRISFGGEALFEKDEIGMLPRGVSIIKKLSEVLLSEERLGKVLEIQIQGHADSAPSQKYSSNLELAARRAMTVFSTLQTFGIDPRYAVMSATTFGEYVPVQRRSRGIPYSPELLAEDNNSSEKMMMNRRIEILLIYRRLSTSSSN